MATTPNRIPNAALRALLMTAALLTFSTTAAAEKILRIATHAGLSGLDPIWTTAYITRNHGYLIYDTLFALDEDFQVQPQMVDSWEVSDDEQTYTLTLREGLAWHDGDPVTPDDCIASIKRWGERDPLGKRLLSHASNIEATDDRTFVIELARPYARVIESLAKVDSNVAFMMKAEHAETPASTELAAAIGSGPFRFAPGDYKPGEFAAYLRNDAYAPREEPPSGTAGSKVVKVDRVEWHYHRKPADALRALSSGKVDIWESPTPDALKRIRRDDAIVLAALDSVGFQGSLRINHQRSPFNDPRVRQALAHAVDQNKYLDAIVGSGTEAFRDACPAFFTCSKDPVLEGSEALAGVDLDQAKELLREAGYKRERIIILNPKDFHHLDAAARVTADTLKRIGMRVKVQNVSWRKLTERRANRGKRNGWHLFPTAFNGITAASPLTNIGIRTGKDAWFGWPSDPAVPKLTEAYADAPDAASQREALSRLSTRLFEVMPYINFGQWSTPVAYRREVSGLLASPVPVYWNVAKTN